MTSTEPTILSLLSNGRNSDETAGATTTATSDNKKKF